MCTFTGFVKVTNNVQSGLLKKTSAMLSIDCPANRKSTYTYHTVNNFMCQN